MEEVILCLVPFLFIVAWYVVTTYLRNMARMSKRLNVETGCVIRSSGWGSATINGVGGQNCVKIDEHSEGLVVRTMWLFGAGKLWLPKSLLKVGQLEKGNFFIPRNRVLICEMNQVIIYGRLADFVEDFRGEHGETHGENG